MRCGNQTEKSNSNLSNEEEIRIDLKVNHKYRSTTIDKNSNSQVSISSQKESKHS